MMNDLCPMIDHGGIHDGRWVMDRRVTDAGGAGAPVSHHGSHQLQDVAAAGPPVCRRGGSRATDSSGGGRQGSRPHSRNS